MVAHDRQRPQEAIGRALATAGSSIAPLATPESAPELRAQRVGDQLLIVGFLRRSRAGSKELRAVDLRLTHRLQVAIERRRGNPRRALIAFGHGDQRERVRDQVVIVAKEECGLS